MPDLPGGTVTFLFTDIEGSTARWEQDRQAMQAAVEQHLDMLRAAASTHDGVLFKVVGDAVQVAFHTAPDTVVAALETQRALHAEPWPAAIGPLRVRMALHTAAAQPQDGDYLAPGLNRLSRLLAAAHGGQVLLSLATQDLARDALPPDASLRDLGEHPLRDLYRPERVFQLLHPELPAHFPPLRTLAAHPNNLPLQPTPFLGREEQVAGIVDLLRRDDVRLLTITGSGGVGKTRLALQAAADLLEDFPDGVWFVDLSPLQDPQLVLPTIGAVLGVREGEVRAEHLSGVLGGKRVLLVLDNFERVLAAVRPVADLLARVPGVKVLATSRIPLRAYGEQEYPLAPLPLPDPARLPPVAGLTQYEAVRLFVARARAVSPDFTVTNANAPAIAEICFRLDGLPLAIELAAARIKVLPPQALLKRLEQRLPLLTGGARTLPARQQTMRDAIAWSYDVLSVEEQTLFRRLAVFPGGCTIDAAEAVAGEAGVIDVFSGMVSLVDASLLRQERSTEGEPRFRMLETVREFGQDQLAIVGEADGIGRRAALWCLTLAEEAGPDLEAGTRYNAWLLRLDAELPNLRAAIAWFLAANDSALALRLLAVSHEYWGYRSQHVGRLEPLDAALAASDVPARDRAAVHHILVIAESRQGKLVAAAERAQQVLALAREADDEFLMGLAHMDIALVSEYSGDGAGAGTAYAAAVPYFRAIGNTMFAAWALSESGDKLVWTGDVAGAADVLDEALSLHRQIGFETGIAMTLGHLGFAALVADDLPCAAQSFAESLRRAQAMGDVRIGLGATAGLAGVARAAVQPERAARLLGATEAAREASGLDRIAHTLHAERITAATRAALPAAAYAQAWSAGRALPLEDAIAEALALAEEIAARERG